MDASILTNREYLVPRRSPETLDYYLFFIGVPAGVAFLFSLVGNRLTAGMGYLDGLVYMILHMLLA